MKFHGGDFSLDNAPQSARPVEVDSDQIKTLIENNQLHATQETANTLKISKSIKLLVKIKKHVLYFMGKTKWAFGQPNTSCVGHCSSLCSRPCCLLGATFSKLILQNKRGLDQNVHRGLTQNNPELQASQMSINRGVNKQTGPFILRSTRQQHRGISSQGVQHSR